MMRRFCFHAIFHLKFIVNEHISHQFTFNDTNYKHCIHFSIIFCEVYVNRCFCDAGHAYEYFNVIRSRVDFILMFSIFKFSFRSSFFLFCPSLKNSIVIFMLRWCPPFTPQTLNWRLKIIENSIFVHISSLFIQYTFNIHIHPLRY